MFKNTCFEEYLRTAANNYYVATFFLKILVVLYMNSEKVLLFGNKSLEMSILFDINSLQTLSMYYLLVVTLWKCQYRLMLTLKTQYFLEVSLEKCYYLYQLYTVVGGNSVWV